jgi:hypothetical protein
VPVMDPEMLTGAVIAAGAFLSGLPVGALVMSRRLRSRTPEQPKPICGCQHSKGSHEDGSGRCLASVKQGRWDEHGTPVGYNWVDCSCTTYIGPEPLSEFYAPPRYLPEDAS